MSVPPVSGPSSTNYYLPVQPVPKVVPSQQGAAPAPQADAAAAPGRTPSPLSGRLLDIRV